MMSFTRVPSADHFGHHKPSSIAPLRTDHHQRNPHDLRSSLRLLGSSVLREHRLNLLPQPLGNDCLMLAGIAVPLVDYLAPIGTVAEQALDVAGIPGYRWSMYSFLRGPGFGAVALLVEPGGQRLGQGQLDESSEDMLDQRSFLRIDEKLLLLPFNVVVEDGRGASVLTVPLGVATLSRMRSAMTSRSYCAKVIRVPTTEHRTCSHNPRN